MTMLRASISLFLCTSLALPSVATANTYAVAFQEAEAEAAEDEAPPPPDTLSDEEKLDWAKKLYMKAKAYHDAEDYYNSVIKYEEAYRYAPDKHIFAYNLGIDAWELRDCARVKQYLQLFMIKDDSHPDLRKTAKEILDQADGNTECVTAGGNGVVADQGGGTAEPVTDDDGPELTAKGRPDSGLGDTGPKKKPSGLLIGGSVLTVVGVGALGAGIATTIIAKGKHTTLTDATQPSPTSFADDYYGDLRGDESTLKTLNVVNPILLIAGGLMVAGGITMIVIDRGNKKKGKGHYAKQNKAKLTGLGIGPTAGGAAASMTLQF